MSLGIELIKVVILHNYLIVLTNIIYETLYYVLVHDGSIMETWLAADNKPINLTNFLLLSKG